MTLKKIGEISQTHMCRHPEHNPPNMIVLESGIYEHTCPGCGNKIVFRVENPTLAAKAEPDSPDEQNYLTRIEKLAREFYKTNPSLNTEHVHRDVGTNQEGAMWALFEELDRKPT